MKALSFTVLVAPSGVGVKVTGCGGERWSSFFFTLLQCAILPPLFFFVLPVNNTLASLQRLRGCATGASGAAGGGEEEDGAWYTEDAASVSLYFLLLPPVFCWCFSVHSTLSFSLSFSFFSLPLYSLSQFFFLLLSSFLPLCLLSFFLSNPRSSSVFPLAVSVSPTCFSSLSPLAASFLWIL